MNDFKKYLQKIACPKPKNAQMFLILYILIVLLIPVLTSFLAHLYSNEQGRYLQGALLYGMIPCFLYIIYKNLRSILFGKEAIFLRKIGFSYLDFLLYIVDKFRWHYLVFAGFYSWVYFVDGFVNMMTLLLCLVNAFLLFSTIYFLLLIYIAVLSQFNIMHFAKAVVLLPIFSYVNAIVTKLDACNTLQQNIYDILGFISAQSISKVLVNLYIMPNFIHVLLALAALLCFIMTYLRKPDLIDKPLSFVRRRPYTSNKNIKIRTHTGSTMKAFIKRDTLYLATKPSYISVQGATIIIGACFLITMDEIPFMCSAVFLGIVCLFNCMFLQELFYIDSQFILLYKKLPLCFRKFMTARIITTLLYALWVPMLYLLFQLFLNKVSFIAFVALFAVLLAGLFFLCLYFSSVILFFFPSVKQTTDIPFLISIFLLVVPFMTLIIIYLGMRKGKRDWRRWT